MKIGLAIEPSELEIEGMRLGMLEDEVLEVFKTQGRNIENIIAREDEYRESVGTILAMNADAELVEVDSTNLKRSTDDTIDVLIVVGSEHWFRVCAYIFEESMLLGVNANPLSNQSAILTLDSDHFATSVENILHDCFGMEEWTRVSTLLNGKELEDAVCSVSLQSTDWMDYTVRMGAFDEEQRASGFLVVSGAGSGPGSRYQSAGLYLPAISSGEFTEPATQFSKTDRMIFSLTREPYRAEDCSYKGLNMFCSERNAISLTYCSLLTGTLSIDGIHHHEIRNGDTLLFQVSETPLRTVLISA